MIEQRRLSALVDDLLLLGRMVANLITNAQRHAGTEIAVSLHTRDGDIELIVEDDGPGVPTAERDRVFERFVRLEEGRGRAEGGTGLGLAIVSGVAGVHGGRVEVVDGARGGARFVVTMPVQVESRK
ncbi:MAG: ATP-binding protein [Actinomycetota bacterium]|nr:ATP-binding protein [Actinomycetota bacterium]